VILQLASAFGRLSDMKLSQALSQKILHEPITARIEKFMTGIRVGCSIACILSIKGFGCLEGRGQSQIFCSS
jgi:uncharacterized membrane protein